MSSQPVASSDIPTLESQARDAYEKNQIRECLRIVNTLVAIHPDNETGNRLHNAISSDIDRILKEARALIEERQEGSVQGRWNAAALMISKVLEIDPDHKGANLLLQAVRNLSKTTESARTRPEKEIPFTVIAGRKPEKSERRRGSSGKLVFFLVMALAAGGLVYAKQIHFKGIQSAELAPYLKSIAAALPMLPASQVSPAPPPVIAEPPTSPTPVTSHPSAGAKVVVTSPRQIVASAQFGSLAVSSPVATDIYSGSQYVGSTPLTLQLPAGTQTLEYRHATMRKTVTHMIKADETTSALITFDVVVQINARPWAQVYLDGSERQPLGQTPLSNIQVPIGRTLIFENPQFPTKTYRITGNESAIQVVFP